METQIEISSSTKCYLCDIFFVKCQESFYYYKCPFCTKETSYCESCSKKLQKLFEQNTIFKCFGCNKITNSIERHQISHPQPHHSYHNSFDNSFFKTPIKSFNNQNNINFSTIPMNNKIIGNSPNEEEQTRLLINNIPTVNTSQNQTLNNLSDMNSTLNNLNVNSSNLNEFSNLLNQFNNIQLGPITEQDIRNALIKKLEQFAINNNNMLINNINNNLQTSRINNSIINNVNVNNNSNINNAKKIDILPVGNGRKIRAVTPSNNQKNFSGVNDLSLLSQKNRLTGSKVPLLNDKLLIKRKRGDLENQSDFNGYNKSKERKNIPNYNLINLNLFQQKSKREVRYCFPEEENNKVGVGGSVFLGGNVDSAISMNEKCGPGASYCQNIFVNGNRNVNNISPFVNISRNNNGFLGFSSAKTENSVNIGGIRANKIDDDIDEYFL